MANYLGTKQWGTVFASVVNRGKTLKDEAQRLGIEYEELLKMGDKKFTHSTEWENCKRLSEKREKKQVSKKRKPVTTKESAPTSAPTSAQDTSTPAPAPAHSDSMEELLRKKKGIQKELVTCATSLEEAEAILAIRQEALSDAQSVLEKAQAAVQQAQSDVDEAKTVLQQAQTRQAETQQALQQVEEEILRNQVYLIAPWYSGELPAFGTFFSIEEMEGVQVLKPAELIEPDFKDMVSAGFDLGSEYMKALSFVSLVQEYILAGKEMCVLNTDPRVKKLLGKHIG